MKTISIVIPCYNSSGNLSELFKQTSNAMGDLSFELILVNDQSKDDTWNEIVALAKENKNIYGVNLRKNSGQDNAIFAGLHYATGEYIVIMDDDLQHSPYDIKRLYEKVMEGYDVCYADFEKKQQALWKNVGSWFNGKVSEIVINKPKNIYLSPFKIIKNDVVKEILNYKYLYPYIDGMIFAITHNITQIEATHHNRYNGKSNYNLVKSISVFMKLATSFSVVPLRIASFIGIIASLLGFFIGFYLIFQYFVNSHTIEGWTSLMVMILFLGGLILFSLGIIGEYLGRTYLNISNKPPYTIKETTNERN